MNLIARIVLNGLGLWAAAQLLPGIHWDGGVFYLLVAGAVLGVLNLLVKPILTLFSIPLLLITLGLFYLVINGVMLWLADLLLARLHVDSFLWAIAGGFFLAIFNLFVRAFEKD
jgi:putative membrane protein